MRKIYQSAPDVPQGIANRAIDIVERHMAASGVRRAEELPEENKVHLLRELQKFFQSELPPLVLGKEGKEVYARGDKGGMIGRTGQWIIRILHSRESRL
ncbi:MAG TPA: hypothetical protein VGK34_08355 [Armatimonadota bacterium]